MDSRGQVSVPQETSDIASRQVSHAGTEPVLWVHWALRHAPRPAYPRKRKRSPKALPNRPLCRDDAYSQRGRDSQERSVQPLAKKG